MKVTLEESTHEYRTETGIVQPALTKVIAVVMQSGSWGHSDDAAMRGTAVHRASAKVSMDGWKVERFHPVIQPFVAGWVKFEAEMGYKADWWERSLGSDLGYAGTPDTGGLMRGEPTLIEEKSGSVPLTVGIQLAGQAHLLKENHPELPTMKRRVVHLPGDGTFNLLSGITHPKYGRLDFNDAIWDQWFFSCLNVFNSGYFKIPEFSAGYGPAGLVSA